MTEDKWTARAKHALRERQIRRALDILEETPFVSALADMLEKIDVAEGDGRLL